MARVSWTLERGFHHLSPKKRAGGVEDADDFSGQQRGRRWTRRCEVAKKQKSFSRLHLHDLLTQGASASIAAVSIALSAIAHAQPAQMGRGGQAATPPFDSTSNFGLRGDENPQLEHYTVLDGAAYDLRRMLDHHPGGSLALRYAGGKDMTRTWAGAAPRGKQTHWTLAAAAAAARTAGAAARDARDVGRETERGNTRRRPPRRPARVRGPGQDARLARAHARARPDARSRRPSAFRVARTRRRAVKRTQDALKTPSLDAGWDGIAATSPWRGRGDAEAAARRVHGGVAAAPQPLRGEFVE